MKLTEKNDIKKQFLTNGIISQKQIVSSKNCKLVRDKIQLPKNLTKLFQNEKNLI
mgnify:FL=1